MLRRLAFTKAYTQSARLRVFLVSVMLLLVPLSIYFSMHISNRTKYFNDRNFRQLGNFSRQISQRIDSLGTAFASSVDNFAWTPENKGCSLEAHLDISKRCPFQSYLDILKTDGTNFTVETIKPIPAVKDQSDLETQVSISLAHKDRTSWLYFDGVDLKGTVYVTAKTNFDDLIKPLISKSGDDARAKGDIPEEFDHILVARADDGKVLFESANDDLTLTSLDELPLADASDKHLDLKTRSKASDSVDVTLAGSRYKLYAQPIEIGLQTKDSQNRETLWVICGLVEAGHFRYQTWAISYTVLIVSAFFGGLLILSWFFLKLIFIGPKDRLRVAETLMLAVSVVIVGSLLTFFLLFGITYTQLEQTEDEQLFNLANNFQSNFQQEVRSALKQIKNLDCKRPDAGKESVFKTKLLTSLWAKDGCDQAGNPYPYFKMVAWIDDSGQQVAKWTISSETTKLVDVSARDYFNKLKNGYYHELDGEKFWLEPITAKNTGAFTVVISEDAKADKIPKASVVALDTNLMSLIRPAMVSGFGYRIIDGNGDVLFPNLKENFFAESENNNRLRSAVTGHLSDFVNVPYLGRDARVYVTPLQKLPDWTIVVFRDKEPLRSSFTEIVVLSATLFFIYLLPLLLLLAILFIASLISGKRMKWMWPSAESAPNYLQSILISVLLTLIAWEVSPPQSFRGLFLLSVLSMIALVMLIVSPNRKWALKPSVRLASFLERQWARIDYRALYLLCLATLVLIIAVLPSLTFFRLAYDEEMDLFIKYGQVTLVNNLNEREERLRAAYPTEIFTDKAWATIFRETRSKVDLDRYYAFFFGTKINEDSTNFTARADQETILGELRKRLPFSHPSSIVRHGLVANVSGDGLWQWDGNDSNLALQAPRGSANGNAFFNISSNTQRFPLHKLGLFPLIAAMIVILFLLIRFIVNRVFLLDMVESARLDVKALAPASIRKLFVVLGLPYTQREKLLPATDFKILNLKTESEWPDNFNRQTFLNEEPSKAIAIECFEYQIDQPQYNLRKLELLEELINCERPLLIASTAEPGDYIFENEETSKNRNGSSDISARWASVLSNFWIDYREDSGDPDAFESKLGEMQGKSQDKHERELYGLLIKECAPRACLQEIGREIAKRRNLKTSSRDELISDVLVQANTYYQLIWESCSPTEKLTLAHLAVDGFLSINDPDVPRLVRRGLIVRDREIRLMNESFRLFVLNKSHTDKEVAVTEGQARKSSSWQYLKVLLLVTVIGLLVFLFATQRDLYNTTLLALTSIVGGVPIIFKFFSLFQRDGGATGSSAPPSH